MGLTCKNSRTKTPDSEFRKVTYGMVQFLRETKRTGGWCGLF